MSQAPPPQWPPPVARASPQWSPCGQGGGHYKQPCKHEPGHVIYDTPYSDEQACTQTYLDFCINGEYIYNYIYMDYRYI